MNTVGAPADTEPMEICTKLACVVIWVAMVKLRGWDRDLPSTVASGLHQPNRQQLGELKQVYSLSPMVQLLSPAWEIQTVCLKSQPGAFHQHATQQFIVHTSAL